MEEDHGSTERLIIYYLWAIVSPILLTLGTIGNLLSIAVLTRRNLRSSSASVYLIALAIADIMVLLTGLVRQFIRYVGSFDVRDTSNFGCKCNIFLVYASLDISVWILVVFTFERILAVFTPHKVKTYCTRVSSTLAIVGVVVIMVVYNGHLVFGFGIKVTHENNTADTSECYFISKTYEDFFLDTLPWVDLCVYSLVPFVTLITGNSCIAVKVVMSRRRTRRVAAVDGTVNPAAEVRVAAVDGTLNPAAEVRVAAVDGTLNSAAEVRAAAVDGTLNPAAEVRVAAVDGTINSAAEVRVAVVDGTLNSAAEVRVAAVDGTLNPAAEVRAAAVDGTLNPAAEVRVAAVDGTLNPSVDVRVAAVDGTLNHSVDVRVAAVDGTLNHSVDVRVAAVDGTLNPAAEVRVAAVDGTLNPAAEIRVATISLNHRRTLPAPARTARNSSMTVILLVLNLVFLVTTVPVALFGILEPGWREQATTDKQKAEVDLIYAVVNIIMYVNNSINFILYCVTGSRFRKELVSMFLGLRRWARSRALKIGQSEGPLIEDVMTA